MALQFEQFNLTAEHPWTPLVIAWTAAELHEASLLEGSVQDAIDVLADEECAYYGLSDEENGQQELVAFGSLYGPHESDTPGGDREMRLERLVVCRERQGKGLGTIVLGRLEDEARAKGAGVLRLFVEPGDERVKGFYRNRGYQEVDHPYDEELKIFVKPLG